MMKKSDISKFFCIFYPKSTLFAQKTRLSSAEKHKHLRISSDLSISFYAQKNHSGIGCLHKASARRD